MLISYIQIKKFQIPNKSKSLITKKSNYDLKKIQIIFIDFNA